MRDGVICAINLFLAKARLASAEGLFCLESERRESPKVGKRTIDVQTTMVIQQTIL